MDSPNVQELFLILATGIAAVMGHIYPIYIGFKGGKGVATSFGIALGLWPYYTICAIAAFGIWIVCVLLWRYISLGSIAAAVSFPLVLIAAIALKNNWHLADLWPLLIVAVALPLMVVARHRENIKRIIAGTESKVFSSKS
jgi:glycerol-3-phosphate acyltransferase PlsY